MIITAPESNMRTVRLGGVLGRKFGRRHRMAVANVSEAMQALLSQLPGLSKFLTNAKDNGLVFAVFYGTKNLTEDQLYDLAGDDDIRILPIVQGSKSQGWFTVIVGIVLIVVGAILIWTGVGAGIGSYLVKMGVAMVIGGVVQMLAPSPKGMGAADKPENTPSYSFNGSVNTQAQGNPVPLLYGEMIVGSAVASAGIVAVDAAIAPRNGQGRSGSGGWGGMVSTIYWNMYQDQNPDNPWDAQ